MEEYVCKCCLVTREEIEAAVREAGVTDTAGLKNETMATSGCGRCKIMCQHIIDQTIAAMKDSSSTR